VVVVELALLAIVEATPVMPMNSTVVEDRNAVMLAFWDTDIDAKDDDKDEVSGVISVTRLLGTGVRESDERIEESCADTHGDKAVQNSRGVVGRIMRAAVDTERMTSCLCR